MANPQVENGHLDIANEIVEALARIRLSGEESQCLWVVLRKTYGWHKKEDRIALSQFEKATGINRGNVNRALKKLLAKQIITVVKKDYENINSYSFNKDFDKWKPESKKTTAKSILKTTVVNLEDRVLSKKTNTKEKNTKETITKEIYVKFFDIFWKSYPSRNGKKLTKPETWERYQKINECDLELINKAVINYSQSEMVLKGIGIKDPCRFIRDGKGFEYWRDWIDPEVMKTSKPDPYDWIEKAAV